MGRRFVLTDFRVSAAAGRPRLYEAERSYPVPAAVAHTAPKRDLVGRHRLPHRFPPSTLTAPVALTARKIQAAEVESAALERHAKETPAVMSDA